MPEREATLKMHKVNLPYDGLLGDAPIIKVLHQIIADPFQDYRPIDLEELAELSKPPIRDALKTLTSLNILVKDERNKSRPIYRVNTQSKRVLALTFLAYAVLDDRDGTDCTDDVIADYYYSELQEKYESRNAIGMLNLTEYVSTQPVCDSYIDDGFSTSFEGPIPLKAVA